MYSVSEHNWLSVEVATKCIIKILSVLQQIAVQKIGTLDGIFLDPGHGRDQSSADKAQLLLLA